MENFEEKEQQQEDNTKVSKSNLVCACPKCDTSNIIMRRTGKYHCYKCNKEFKTPTERPSKHHQEFRAWSKQTQLKNENIPTVEDIKNIALTITNEKHRALFLTAYLTGGRITEVIAIRRKDFNIKEEGIKKFLIITMPNRKHKKRHFKDIPLSYEKEGDLIRMVVIWVNQISNPEAKIFDISSRGAYKFLKKLTGFNPHFLRHIRITHLVTVYDWTEGLIMRFAGWSNTLPAKDYMELRVRDLMQRW